MCGIFGLVASAAPEMAEWIGDLFRLSESRGKEAAGIALHSQGEITVYKRPVAATRMLREPEFQELIGKTLAQAKGAMIALIGHSRLVTNGLEAISDNNQPVVKSGIVAIHNGIIVNDAELWKRHPRLTRTSQVDTEVFLALMSERMDQPNAQLPQVIAEVFQEIEGTASLAIFPARSPHLLLATNNGSLYTHHDAERRRFLFASERYILDTFLKRRLAKTPSAPCRSQAVASGQGIQVDLAEAAPLSFSFADGAAKSERPLPNPHPSSVMSQQRPASIVNLSRVMGPEESELRRCRKCILPHTMPFIRFDEQGVCNYCHTYEPLKPLGLEALRKLVEPLRSRNSDPDCLVAVSGGRDSCFGLHVLKRELGLNPIAYTYDWGLITDLARRNQARLCGKLGVEHILVSADIRQKRSFVRKNLLAWLRRPRLGMIPILMAGDKQYFYFAEQTRRRLDIGLSFLCENKLERAHFKAGFMGIEEGHGRTFNISLAQKAKTALAYGLEYLRNPGYLNASLLDTLDAFYCSYLLPHDQIQLFDYRNWDEDEVVGTLRRDYNWELATDTTSSWRIGDGTAAFYNYVYYMAAGFTENDALRSNQIRQGVMSREKALQLVAVENQPRWESMQWYANIIGFNLYEALEVVNAMPRLYHEGKAA
jgi:glucosamine--fructose-6-phosphate aminotransferase (isomerizing)